MPHPKHTLTGALLFSACALSLTADTNVSTIDKFAWGENVGFINFADAGSPTGAQGALFGEQFAQGFAWGENIGFINLGAGNGPYANTNDTNFGVNVDPGDGALSGLAWGENVGWINFAGGSMASPPRPARIESGRLRGYAWGENIGWINLDDEAVFVAIQDSGDCPGDANGDNAVDLADLNIVLANFGGGAGGDVTGDGATDLVDLNLVLANFGSLCNSAP